MIISFEDDFGCFQFDNSLRKQFMILILAIDKRQNNCPRFISVIIRNIYYLFYYN